MRTVLTCILCLLSLGLIAQAPYSGGSGDGFATARINGVDPAVGLEEIGSADKVDLTLFPNPVKAGSVVFLNTTAQWHASEVELRNAEGHLLKTQWLPAGKGTHRVHLPTNLPAGFYRIQQNTGAGLKLLIIGH
jgi:hypothetical protein